MDAQPDPTRHLEMSHAATAPKIDIRNAMESDREFVISLMERALSGYHGGDHVAHATRIFNTHIAGSADDIGHFSHEQRMFIVTVDGIRAGMLHLVGKRQNTYKISPIIVDENFRSKFHLGKRLLMYAELYALLHNARQLYCTVAENNADAVRLFLAHGFNIAGKSASHYKEGVTELMLYKSFVSRDHLRLFDEHNISVMPFEERHEPQVRRLLLETLPRDFQGINDRWVDALFAGYSRRSTFDVNQKYKLIFVACDRDDKVVGVAGATPKKGKPIKLMPFIAVNLQAFAALLTDLPFRLRVYGHKLYTHVVPNVLQTIALQQHGWKLDAALPAAYHDDHVTQQWSFDLTGGDFMRTMRVKQYYLDLIRSGRKTLEVRVGYPSIKTIEPGERIRLASSNSNAEVMITAVRTYNSFNQMIEVENADHIAPGRDKGQVLHLLQSLYPPDKERLGAVVLEIKLIKTVSTALQ